MGEQAKCHSSFNRMDVTEKDCVALPIEIFQRLLSTIDTYVSLHGNQPFSEQCRQLLADCRPWSDSHHAASFTHQKGKRKAPYESENALQLSSSLIVRDDDDVRTSEVQESPASSKPPTNPKKVIGQPLKKHLKRPRLGDGSPQSLGTLIKELPSEWRAQQVVIGIDTSAMYQQVIRSLTGKVMIQLKTSRKTLETDASMVSIGRQFASVIRTSFRDAILNTAVFNFSALLFYSYCRLLEKQGTSSEVLDEISQDVPIPVQSTHQRLRNQAGRINQVIHELVESGWCIYRATEYFFICIFLNDHSSHSQC